MAVRLDNLKLTSIEKNSLASGYLYKDINFDISFSRFKGAELYSSSAPSDLSELQDG